MAINEYEVSSGAELARLDDPDMALLAEGLVAATRAQGMQLTGPGGPVVRADEAGPGDRIAGRDG